jgi:hypothetical protein
MQIFEKIKFWWQGEFVHSSLEHALGESEDGASYVRRPRLVVVLKVIGSFFSKEWKWVIGFILTVLALYIAYSNL